MYNAFFEFEENPFSSRPDPAFFYRSKQHDPTIRSLMFAVQARMGLSSLAGEEGTGKTILLECLRDTLESAQIHCAFLRDSRISTNRFFQAVASELDLQCQGTSPYQVFSALHQFTLQQAGKGRTVALIVDDAHNLPADVLNEILHLASLHDDKVKLLQTVLAGRPELHSTLDALNLERLKQHAILSCHLDPFTADETERYIEFRLERAGLPEQTIFPPDALSEIYHRSRGFAPAIHAICEGLLLAAFSAGSKVCTPEILDQVWNPRADEPQVVAVTRIDLTRLVASAEPEPPALLTALLALTFAEIKSMPPLLPVNAATLLEPQRVALRLHFPAWNFALKVGEFARASKKPMRLLDAASAASSTQTEIHAIPSEGAVSKPVSSKPVFQAQPRTESKLQRIRHNSMVLIAPAAAVLPSPIDFPSVAAQPANSAIESLQAATAILTLKGANQLARLPYDLQPNSGSFGQVHVQASALPIPESLVPMHPAAKVSLDRQAVAPRPSNTLFPLDCSVAPRPSAAAVYAGAQSGAQSVSIPVASALQPAHPAASLQPAGTVQLPCVPVPAFAIAQYDPPSARTGEDFQNHVVSLQNPVGPRMGTERTASGESFVPEQGTLVSLACNLAPTAPPAQVPVKNSLSLLQSLRPLGPVSNLEAVNPRNSWLLLPSWKPADPHPVVTNRVDENPAVALETVLAETTKPSSFDRKWLLTLAIPVLSVIALYGFSPVVLPASDALNQSWRRAHQAVVDRAAVVFREDFRAGWDDWMNRGGARPSWTSDAAGFAHPSALALYRPSLGLADYQMQFVGTIDKKALSWVVRAADFNNYYAVQLAVLKPGAVPTIGVIRYAVINGKMQNQVTLPLLMSARSDTVYRVSLDVHGDHFALSVQDRPVDSWSEPKLRQGGVGFFSEQDAASRIAGLQVKGQDDILGKLCAFLAPSGVASYRASLSEHAELVMTSAMNARAGGYGHRLPHSPGRLDPAFWQVPEVNLPNARRCSPPISRLGVVRTRRSSPFTGVSASTVCY